MYLIDGKPACLFVAENLARQHSDGVRHFYPAFVKAFEPGFTSTDWDYGTDYPAAREAVEAYNAEHGVNRDAAMLIVTTSMFPHAPIAMADIYRANGEELESSGETRA
ncbi:MAG: hypothetical protein JO101_04055 [Candidatus Eremiobacteraeota bacterium]|nr:hypothetical protein [Candidatus Eremiobacteraeota bacterium]MBV8354469.1 hypothetical protein [Candidatus Eremiobacteraeota bacterium]